MNKQTKLTRREREKLNHKHEIQKAAIKAFAEKGYDSATLEEIATEAEFSKGALYLYFKNKEDLFHSLLNDGLSEIQRILNENLNGSKTIRAEIHEFIDQLLIFMKKNKDLIRVLSVQEGGTYFSLDKAAQKDLIAKHSEIHQLAEKRFRNAISAGEIKKVESNLISAIFHGFIHECYRTSFADNHTFTCSLSDQDIHTMADLIFDGIKKESTK